jgi:hypothetical protein
MTTIPALSYFEFQVVIIHSASRRLLVFVKDGEFRLARVQVPRGRRTVREICVALKQRWGLSVIVLEILFGDGRAPGCVIAKPIEPVCPPGFETIRPEQLAGDELPEESRVGLEQVLEDTVPSPLSSLGWFDDAVVWVEETTQRKVVTRTAPEQFNGGRAFTLICFPMDDGRRYWLKATGYPNRHEYDVTTCLYTLCPSCLPRLVATRRDWNAWLTEDAGISPREPISSLFLVRATGCLSQLQRETIPSIDLLLAAGAVDQRLPILRGHIEKIVDSLILAMSRQTSTKSSPVPKVRLLELGAILRDAFLRMEALAIPDTLMHNDLNTDNILFDGNRYVITDWCEAAVGNPFFSFDQLCRRSDAASTDVRTAYANSWSQHLTQSTVEEAFLLTPLLAIYTHLYGRGSWMDETSVIPPKRESYARSLARHLDRAAQNPRLLEVLRR